MTWQYNPYTIPLLITAALSTGIAVYVINVHCLRRTGVPGAGYFAALLLGVAEWCTAASLDYASVELQDKVFWASLSYLGIGAVPVSWLLFALHYTGRERSVAGWRSYLLFLLPATTFILALTSDLHGLLRRSQALVELDTFVSWTVEFGPWFWVHAAYLYILLAIGSIVLMRGLLRAPSIYRGQAVMVLIGAVTPWVLNAIYIFGIGPSYLDLSPFGFAVTGGVVSYALFRYRLLDVVPVARDAVLEEMDDAVIVLDHGERIADLNPAAALLLESAVGELVGYPASEALATLNGLPACLAAGSGSAEVELDRRGETLYMEVRTAPLHMRGRSAGTLILLRDVSERRRAQEERVLTERLRAAGELAAGIGHNLNNILTGILGPASRIRDHSEDAIVRDNIEVVLSSAERARDLVQRLGKPVRSQEEIHLEGIDVNGLVREVVAATSPRWQDEAGARGVEIDLNLELAQVPPVTAERTELYELVMNLVLNAVDALPDGGRITVQAASAGADVLLQVADTGIGMDEATRRRVFEPFFTTKVNVGSGLGLSTAYRAVNRWGGELSVTSAPGEGSTFTLLLHAWEGELEEAVAETEPAGSTDGPARILVAEDEAIVAMVLTDTLSTLGYEADVAADGDKALKMIASAKYDLAVLDLGLPGVSGEQVAAQLKCENPRAVAILMTGWSLAESDPRLEPFDLSLEKPFAANAVRKIIAQALELRERS